LEKALTKEELTAALKDCTAKLGHLPNLVEFRRLTKISKNQIRKCFGTYTRMLYASGEERLGSGYIVSLPSLFLDWAKVVRGLGRVPTVVDYEMEGSYSIRPLLRRFKTWGQVPAGLLDYARQQGLEGEWKDVLEIIEDYRGDTFRAVYTLKYADVLFMLHAFQKKSKTGRETPRRDIELIKQRLREAERIAKEMMS